MRLLNRTIMNLLDRTIGVKRSTYILCRLNFIYLCLISKILRTVISLWFIRSFYLSKWRLNLPKLLENISNKGWNFLFNFMTMKKFTSSCSWTVLMKIFAFFYKFSHKLNNFFCDLGTKKLITFTNMLHPISKMSSFC